MSCFCGVVRWDDGPVPHRLNSGLDLPGLARPRWVRSDRVLMQHRQRFITPQDRWERQPCQAGTGRYTLVLDGWLADRDALAARLHEPASQADSTLLLAAIQRWGPQAAAQCRGNFAFAAWDDHTGTLLLGCDALGQRVVYYHAAPGQVWFASTLRDLLARPEIERRLNPGVLADLLVHTRQDRPETVWRDITKLQAGTVAVLTGQGAQIHRFWQPQADRRLCLADDGAYVDQMRALLADAVAGHMAVDGPLAATLTGGLDSSAIAIQAARLLAPDRLITLTAVPTEGSPLFLASNGYADETSAVQAIVEHHPGLDPNFVTVDMDQCHFGDDYLFAVTGRPQRLGLQLEWLAALQHRARARGAKAVLWGHGGNLGFSWDGLAQLADLARTGAWGTLARHIVGLARHSGQSVGQIARQQVIRPLMPTGWVQYRLRRQGWRWPLWRQHSPIALEFGLDHRVDDRIAERGSEAQGRYRGSARQILCDEWQARMAGGSTATDLRDLTGVEVRNPLFDARIVDFCLAIPGDQFLRGGVTRWLARRVLADQLPPSVVKNRQSGSQFPEKQVYLRRHRHRLRADLDQIERSSLARAALDLPRLRQALDGLDRPPSGDINGFNEETIILHRGLVYGRFLRWVEGSN